MANKTYPYTQYLASKDAVELNAAIMHAWDKLPDNEQDALTEIGDQIIAYQTACNKSRAHNTQTIANGYRELLGKLGVFLAGVDYHKIIAEK